MWSTALTGKVAKIPLRAADTLKTGVFTREKR